MKYTTVLLKLFSFADLGPEKDVTQIAIKITMDVIMRLYF
jgi:hypothetical protein